MKGATTSFHAATFGCKVNQYETQSLREAWLRRGFTEVDTPEGADVILVNTCAVTARAVSDVRRAIARLHRAAPAAGIVVTGCAAQVLREEFAGLPGVVAVVPQEAKATLAVYDPAAAIMPPVSTHDAHGDAATAQASSATSGDVVPAQASVFPDFRIEGFRRARPVVKVQDGCSHRCTYCIVPLTRGASRSREPGEVVAELRRLLDAGFREVMLSGVNLRLYGRDLSGAGDFWDLLQRVERELAPEWAGRARLRISSLEPGQLGAHALDVLGGSRLVCPQLHLSLQSGSPDVLRRMGRGHYSPAPLLDFLRDLGGTWPVFGLGADILMGFPGESEDAFAETLDFVRALPLTYAHVFPYSRRPGTVAASLPEHLPQEIRKARAAAVRDVVAQKRAVFAERLAGLPALSVVLDGAGARKGISEYYAECRVRRVPHGHDHRAVLTVRPVGVEAGCVVTEAV
ncbi:MiaB/RimO family radical SAM methylthiotransferase [Nitratidesulfovibrio vulgaris]|uniref:MiaB/RimO family radical SAM methylthiotransferase n=1 Tax=Nitratidesulfovibrio vulgaris TaxID=881 RepID=UPI0023004A61|nr:MiaB/RimO family radical SAM methylthiotransferase [Nitratidesulfovibrio vulgaris]WCB47544.1 MiaB/RimO family radical SAM methylthiotransferase [Nitratidesulfovibrio vulgaris]